MEVETAASLEYQYLDFDFDVYDEACLAFVDINNAINGTIQRNLKKLSSYTVYKETREVPNENEDEKYETTREANISVDELSMKFKSLNVRLAEISNKFDYLENKGYQDQQSATQHTAHVDVHSNYMQNSENPRKVTMLLPPVIISEDEPDYVSEPCKNTSSFAPNESTNFVSATSNEHHHIASLHASRRKSDDNRNSRSERRLLSVQDSLRSLCSTFTSFLGGSYSFVNIQEAERVCFNCVNMVKVQNIYDLAPGDHLAFQRAVGYQHHAILVKAELNHESNDHTVGKLTVIHKTANAGETAAGMVLIILTAGYFGKKAYLREETIQVNFKKSDIYIIQYKTRPFTSSGIIRRARAEVKKQVTGQQDVDFNLFRDNCEHFATWCATGEWFSFQIDLIKSTLTALRSTNTDGYKIMLQNLNQVGLLCTDCYKATNDAVVEEENLLSRGIYVSKKRE